MNDVIRQGGFRTYYGSKAFSTKCEIENPDSIELTMRAAAEAGYGASYGRYVADHGIVAGPRRLVESIRIKKEDKPHGSGRKPGRKPGRKLTYAEADLRERLYAQGLTDAEMATQLGITPPAVVYWRAVRGYPANVKQRNQHSRRVDLDLLREYLAQGLSNKEIASRMGVSPETIRRNAHALAKKGELTNGKD